MTLSQKRIAGIAITIVHTRHDNAFLIRKALEKEDVTSLRCHSAFHITALSKTTRNG